VRIAVELDEDFAFVHGWDPRLFPFSAREGPRER
jgi:hypothetical protein